MRLRLLLVLLLIAGGAGSYLIYTGQLDTRAAIDTVRQHVDALKEPAPETDPQATRETTRNRETAAKSTSDNRPPAVTVATATEANFLAEIMVTGSLVAREEILIAPEVDGLRLLTLAVEEGDFVEQGDLLATLEKETLIVERARSDATIARAEAAIAQARSRVTEAEAVLAEAEAQLQRAKPLKERRVLSDSIFDERRAAATTAQARLKTAQDGVTLAQAEKAELLARRREIEWRLSKTEIRAPRAGLVTRRTARVGAVASSASTPLFHLARDGEIELEAQVIAPKLARIREGQTAKVAAGGVPELQGRVRLVSPEVDPAKRLGKVRIFLGRDERLRIGAFARATIRAEQRSGLSLPLSAILFRGKTALVQKVEDSRVHSTTVTLGLQTNGQVEIREGLSQGDRVVAKSGTFLRDGDEIRAVAASGPVSEARL